MGPHTSASNVQDATAQWNRRAAPTGYPVTLNGDHAEFEAEHANTPPHERPDWPLPSFDATDWAAEFCRIANNLGYKNPKGELIDEDWMHGWFANALMRGYDEHAMRSKSS